VNLRKKKMKEKSCPDKVCCSPNRNDRLSTISLTLYGIAVRTSSSLMILSINLKHQNKLRMTSTTNCWQRNTSKIGLKKTAKYSSLLQNTEPDFISLSSSCLLWTRCIISVWSGSEICLISHLSKKTKKAKKVKSWMAALQTTIQHPIKIGNH
jgi:hypothetical protein